MKIEEIQDEKRDEKNPWFSRELSDTIHQRNVAWAKARRSDFASDLSIFRQLRNKCTSLMKRAKSEYYLFVTTENLNNPQNFWKVIKSLSVLKALRLFQHFFWKTWPVSMTKKMIKMRWSSSLTTGQYQICVSCKKKDQSLVCDQLKEFLNSNYLPSKLSSGFRENHSTITAATKVINDIFVALD